MTGVERPGQVVAELFGIDVHAYLNESSLIDPDTVDTEAVAADLYQQHGHTNLDAIPHEAFWCTVDRHRADPDYVPNPPYDLPDGVNSWAEWTDR